MGYGGAAGSVEPLSRSGDAGSPASSSEIRLGLIESTYERGVAVDRPVGRPDIQGLPGAPHGAQADPGVFITASRFRSDAYQRSRRWMTDPFRRPHCHGPFLSRRPPPVPVPLYQRVPVSSFVLEALSIASSAGTALSSYWRRIRDVIPAAYAGAAIKTGPRTPQPLPMRLRCGARRPLAQASAALILGRGRRTNSARDVRIPGVKSRDGATRLEARDSAGADLAPVVLPTPSVGSPTAALGPLMSSGLCASLMA
jgi:hypothetical protein